MGYYSEYEIGDFNLRFKYDVPYFTFFIFDAEDFLLKEKIDSADPPKESFNELDSEFIGYETSVKIARDRMDKYGFNLHFFDEIFDELKDYIESDYLDHIFEWDFECNPNILHKSEEEIIKDCIEHKKSENIELKENLKKISSLDYSNIFAVSRSKTTTFVNFMKAFIDKEKKEKLKNELKLSGASEKLIREYFNFINEDYDLKRIDAEDLWYNTHKLLLYLPPAIPKVSYLILLLQDDYPDIYGLLLIRILLEIVPKNSKISLNLDDVVNSISDTPIEYAKNIHRYIGEESVVKMSLYNKAFGLIYEGDNSLKTIYIKEKLRNDMAEISKIKDSNEKGEFLEKMIRNLFSTNNKLKLSSQRLNLKDEEIDMVYQNNINRPFWMSLQSPHIFIECKNWSRKCGTAQLRIFESKLRDHQNLSRVGLFISFNGFSSACTKYLTRLGRDNYIICLIDKNKIQEYINGPISLDDWLDKIVSSSIV